MFGSVRAPLPERPLAAPARRLGALAAGAGVEVEEDLRYVYIIFSKGPFYHRHYHYFQKPFNIFLLEVEEDLQPLLVSCY